MCLLKKFTEKKRKIRVYNPQLVWGFTLIELIVVVGILILLTSMVAGYSRVNDRQLALLSTEVKMLNLINRAKFLSVETFFKGGGSGAERICAYGVKVDPSLQEIFIFQDRAASCPANNIYDAGERLTGELNELSLRETPVTFGGGTTLREVVFIPPDPQTKINNSDLPEAAIEVKVKVGNNAFIITVSNAGRIQPK